MIKTEFMGKKYIVVKARHLHKLCITDIRKVYSADKKKTPKLPKYSEAEETHCEDCMLEESSLNFDEKLLKETL